MTTLRKVVTLVMLIALAGNSAAASLRPFCCTEPHERQAKPAHACCEQVPSEMAAAKKTATPPRLDPPSCCASKATAGEGARSLPALVDNPCCCIKSWPATPPARHAMGFRSVAPVDHALVAGSLRLADFPPAKQCLRRGQPGLLFSTAPTVCALYCIWLN